CIEKWLTDAGKGSKAKCPTCKRSAYKKDIRPIFAKNLGAVDTSLIEEARKEKERVQKDLEVSRKRCSEVEREWSKLKLMYEASQHLVATLKNEKVKLKGELERVKWESHRMPTAASPDRKKSYTHSNTMSLAGGNSSRVLCYYPTQNMLLVNKAMNSDLHGLLKINMHEMQHQEFYPLHAQCIRDCAVSPFMTSVVMTTSTDRTLVLSSTKSNTRVQTFILTAPGWSCCWDPKRDYYVYVGQNNNTVVVFDIRNGATKPVRTIQDPKMGGPGRGIHSLHFVDDSGKSGVEGLLGGSLAGGFFLDNPVEKSLGVGNVRCTELPKGPLGK
ncbi:RING finger and WD repeat domain-containing protein 3, partial [Quaeritorhiza haematococci]